MKRTKKLVDVKYARTNEQRAVLEHILQEEKCPFCMPNLRSYHTEVLYEYDHWIATHNQWPYEGTQEHWLLILREHAERLSKIQPEAWSELGMVVCELERTLGLSGGALAMRFGDSHVTGATVLHLHVHLIVPQIDQKTHSARVVHFPIG